MPLYSFKCQNDHLFDRYLPVSEYDSLQFCDCGAPSKRVLTIPNIFIRQDCHYESPIDGRPITNRKERLEDMKRSGCIEYDPGVKQDYQRNIDRAERELENKVDATVEAEIEKMPAVKKERLANELQSGLTVEPIRK